MPRCDVAILTYDFRASGVVRNALRIAGVLSASGLIVQFWVIRRKGQLTAEFERKFDVREVRADGLSLPRDVDSLLSAPALARTINRLRPAVLLSVGNQMHFHAALALQISSRRADIRFVGRASNAIISSRKAWSPTRLALGLFETFQFRSMDRIIAVSRELQGDLISGVGADAARIAFIPNGVDCEKARDQSRSCDPPTSLIRGKDFVLGVGRLTRQKDFATLIRAFEIVRRTRSDLHLVIVGHGTVAARRALSTLAEQTGVAEAVTFAGYHANPLAFMAKASLFVSSSRWEGSSNVILEALACGTPVVATAAPTGVREVLEPGDLAPLTPVGDHASLANAILARLTLPRNSARLIQRAGQYPLADSLQGYVECLTSEVMRARRKASPIIQSCKEDRDPLSRTSDLSL